MGIEKDIERLFASVLEKYRGNKAAAAASLDINAVTALVCRGHCVTPAMLNISPMEAGAPWLPLWAEPTGAGCASGKARLWVASRACCRPASSTA